MHCCAIRFTCQALLLCLFRLGPMVHTVTPPSTDDACRKVQQELDKCIDQGNTCDKNRTYTNAEAIAMEAHDRGEFQPELEYLRTCFDDITRECADIRKATSAFAGHCRLVDLDPNRTCSVDPCPGWSLSAYIRGNCVLTWCKSNAPRGIQLLSTAVLITAISLIGYSHLFNTI